MIGSPPAGGRPPGRAGAGPRLWRLAITCGLLGLVAPAVLDGGAARASGAVAASTAKAGAGLMAYVTDPYNPGPVGTVRWVCLASGKTGPPVQVGGQPYWISLSTDGRTAYTANSGWVGSRPQSSVTPIDLRTWRAKPAIPAGLGPMGIGITPDGKRAYVADMGYAPASNPNDITDAYTVTPIDLTTGQPLAPIHVGAGPGAISITPDGRTALVGVDGNHQHPLGLVVPIDLRSGKVGRAVHVGEAPMGMVITPDGSKAFITNTGWSPRTGGTVSPIDLRSMTAGKPIRTGPAPINIAITPDGRRAYVANSGGRPTQPSWVTVLDTRAERSIARIPVPAPADYLATSPDGRWVYATAYRSYHHTFVVPIDTTSDRALPPLQLPIDAGAIVVVKAPAGRCP